MVEFPLASKANSSANVLLSVASTSTVVFSAEYSVSVKRDNESSKMREGSYIYMMSINYKPMNH